MKDKKIPKEYYSNDDILVNALTKLKEGTPSILLKASEFSEEALEHLREYCKSNPEYCCEIDTTNVYIVRLSRTCEDFNGDTKRFSYDTHVRLNCVSETS